jgi:hypothetical protein
MKVNTASMIGFSAKDAYAANFKVSIFDMATNTVVVENAPMTEGIQPITATATTIAGAQAKDVINVAVADVTSFNPADRVSIGGEIYRIKSKDTVNNVFELNRGLVSAVTDGDSVDLVGNLSAFYVELYVTKIGFFLVQAKDSKYGLQYTESVDVRSVLLDDKLDELDTNVDTAIDDIKATATFRIII